MFDNSVSIPMDKQLKYLRMYPNQIIHAAVLTTLTLCSMTI